jgi:F0F1-type ATP synthase alpha subunit
VLFAGARGYVDDLPIERVGAFAQGLRDHMGAQNGELLARIRDEKELSAETEEQLATAIGEYLKGFDGDGPAAGSRPAASLGERDAETAAAGESEA